MLIDLSKTNMLNCNSSDLDEATFQMLKLSAIFDETYPHEKDNEVFKEIIVRKIKNRQLKCLGLAKNE